MEKFASKEDSCAVLVVLGFIKLGEYNGAVYFDSPGHELTGIPAIQIRLYQCANDYWCADAEGGYRAPIVWNGPKADWDKTNTTDQFIDWLNKETPNWQNTRMAA